MYLLNYYTLFYRNVKNEEEIVTVDVYEIQTRDQYTPWPLSKSSIWADTVSLLIIAYTLSHNVQCTHFQKYLFFNFKCTSDSYYDRKTIPLAIYIHMTSEISKLLAKYMHSNFCYCFNFHLAWYSIH